jgi:hypothetical protein
MAYRFTKAYGYNDFVNKFLPTCMFAGSLAGGTTGALQFPAYPENSPRLVENVFGFVAGSAFGAFTGGALCLGHPIIPFLTIPVAAYGYQWYTYKKNNQTK